MEKKKIRTMWIFPKINAYTLQTQGDYDSFTYCYLGIRNMHILKKFLSYCAIVLYVLHMSSWEPIVYDFESVTWLPIRHVKNIQHNSTVALEFSFKDALYMWWRLLYTTVHKSERFQNLSEYNFKDVFQKDLQIR